MKRIRKIVLCAVLMGATTVVTASPSSAVIDNHCLDQQHWDAQFSVLNSQAAYASAVVDAWDHPTVGVDAQTGAPTYTADLPNGYSQVVLGDTELSLRRREVGLQWQHAIDNLVDFIFASAACSL